MLTTKSSRGALVARPMSNNSDVEYNGKNYFFTYKQSGKIKDIRKDAFVSLSFEGKGGLFIHVGGKAQIITAKKVMAEHWVPSLEQWFEKGLDTPGIVMLIVQADIIKYWQKMEEGTLKVSSNE